MSLAADKSSSSTHNGASERTVDKTVAASSPQVAKASQSPKGKFASMSSLLFNIVLPLVILGIGLGIVSALGSVEPKARPADDESLAGRMRRLPPADVMEVLSLKELDQPLELRVDGVVVPYREVAIATEVAGRIVKKSPVCEAGSYVKKGELLIEIDATDYAQEVDRLSRMREQDYEALKEVDQEISNTRKLIEIAKQDVELQEREVKRLESMPSGFASEGELDRAKKSLLTANQSAIGFENQLTLLAARRGKLEAAERLATTQLRGAEINLERTKIYSPVDGVIVREDAELNSFVQRGSPIVTMEDVSKVEVAINLRMDQLLWVLDQREGATAETVSQKPGYSLPATPAVIEFEVAGRSDKRYRWNGTLLRYDGIGLDPRSRTVPVVVLVDKPQQFEGGEGARLQASSPSPLVRGMYVDVRLQIKPRTELVVIPAVAIQPGNRVWQFVQDDSLVKPASTEKTMSDTEGPETDFDPTLWMAGKVHIRRNVVPVDSLWLSTDDGDSVSRERRYWICEIAGSEVVGGSWIVSSPLGDFESELPVRVPVASLK